MPQKVVLKNALDSASYALGVTQAEVTVLFFSGEELDVDLIISGFAQAIKGENTVITVDESIDYLNRYFMMA